MGLARELTMGPRRHRTKIGNQGDYATLRRLTREASPDLELFRTVLDRVGAQATRFRRTEGIVYSAACTRYSALIGEPYGTPLGTF